MSMYETGSAQKPYLPMGEVTYPEESIKRLQPFPPHVSKLFSCSLHALPFCANGLIHVALYGNLFYFYNFYFLLKNNFAIQKKYR